ncbi:sulfotransferase family protein [Ectopseudomonas hydrolytica]|uniref:sulfotransferase family protein n=1 Tax=Ectopseudomonas hydrolytica TaxID=2493633 RepID=UPI00376F317D
MRFIRNIFSRSERVVTPSLVPLPCPVMVVGMHRSGTSFLTGSLQQAGLELGKYSAWNPHNLKGNRENLDIVAFNDAVLNARGFAWDNPPTSSIAWTSEEYARARALIADFAGAPHWGFKDPRSLLLVEGWRELLPDLRFVGIFRHPTAVVQSLQARGGMPEEQALALWAAYNERLLALYRQKPFPLLCFDEDEATLHTKLNQILLELGLQPLEDERFFSAALKHHQQLEQPLPKALQTMYQQLRAYAR